MSRTVLAVGGVFSVTSVLVVDSMVKGTALLILAAIAAIMLRRDSAATRHLVWLLAIVALLAVPILSALLPGWRVLPEWASKPSATDVMATDMLTHATPAADAIDVAPIEEPPIGEMPPSLAYQPDAVLSDTRAVSQTTSVSAEVIPASADLKWNARITLPLVWATGLGVLFLRLMAARWILWRIEQQGTAICSAAAGHALRRGSTKEKADAGLEALQSDHQLIVSAFEAAYLRLGLYRPVTLLLHSNKTIPLIWGIHRSRVLLPATARAWSGEQLQSVLLHELAHVKRCDMIAQLLAQLACALYWFHPLVWLAAWRLGVEREQACDDLVLKSGVRPSAYAGHLLDVVHGLESARWTRSCGLAMARKTSLENRLAAVLSRARNRRGVSQALAAIALAVAAGIAVPIAMLRAADETASAPTEQPSADMNDDPQKSGTDTKLPPGPEAQLDWGVAVDGLRSAIIIHAPDPGGPPGVYLVVQNVSAESIRLCDTMNAERKRSLYVSASGKILFAIASGEPMQTDVLLQPGEVTYLPMFPPVSSADGESAVPALIEGLRKDSLQTWRGVLEIANAPDGAWKGKLMTAETRGAIGTEGPQPQSQEARALYKLWKNYARLNGDIPSGLISRLHDKVQEFIRNNTGDVFGDPYAKKMAPLVQRFAVVGDWKPAEVVALLDDIAAVTTIPLETTMEHLAEHTIQYGQPLPASLANAGWGEPLPCGLRTAFLLEPRAEAYHLGTEVKARILLHNGGKQPVTFITRSFQQPGHQAKLANGQNLEVDSMHWTTRGRPVAYRLEPGEYCETIVTPGIGIGKRNEDNDDWSNVRAGSWILCEAGDEVTLLPGPAMLTSDERPGDANWWPELIAERVGYEAPVPQDAKEREYLLYRVVRDLFGTAPSTDQGESFGADKSPDALANLASLLSKNKYLVPCEGPIRAGETKFRVLPPDPLAANRPRVAKNPGRYNLGEKVRLVVTRRPVGERIVNEGSVTYYRSGGDNISHDLQLPDGYDTWAAAWVRGTTVLWVQEEGLLRKIDFTNAAKVEEVRFEGVQAADAPIPPDVREALRAALAVSVAPNTATQTGPPAAEQPIPAADQPPAAAATQPENPDSHSLSSRPQPRDTETNDDANSTEIAESGGTLTEVLAHESRIPLRASFLIVRRDWSNGEDEKIQDEIRRTVAELADTPVSRMARKHLGEAGAIGPDFLVSSDGMPSIFGSEDFANLRSWLRTRGLLLGELSIEQQPELRTEERWKAWFDLSATGVPRVQGKWWLVADVRPALTRPDEAGVFRVVDHPYYLADIHVSRSQQVMTQRPGGPFLRGAAIGKNQQFSFYLPKNRVVAMDWDGPYNTAPAQAGPSYLPKVLLVIEDARMPEPPSGMAVFGLPERIGSLYLADERRWLSPPEALARINPGAQPPASSRTARQ